MVGTVRLPDARPATQRAMLEALRAQAAEREVAMPPVAGGSTPGLELRLSGEPAVAPSGASAGKTVMARLVARGAHVYQAVAITPTRRCRLRCRTEGRVTRPQCVEEVKVRSRKTSLIAQFHKAFRLSTADVDNFVDKSQNRAREWLWAAFKPVSLTFLKQKTLDDSVHCERFLGYARCVAS